MRIFVFALLQVLVFLPLASYAAERANPVGMEKIDIIVAQKATVQSAYGKLPLYFTENKGQVDGSVKFYEKGVGHATFFTAEGVVLTLTKSIDEGEKEPALPSSLRNAIKENKDKKFSTEAVRLSFIDGSKTAKITSSAPLPGHVNYFIGNDKSRWRSNVPTYRAVTYENIYKNINIKFYGNNKNIEHDIIVSPGGNPGDVKFLYEGIKGLDITKEGNLVARLADGEIIEKKPIVYQEIKGKRKTIDGSYRILKGKDGTFTYGYDVASYDKSKELVIDPVLTYSTYLGGTGEDYGEGIAIDASGAVYVTGNTMSTDFPVIGPIQANHGGGLTDAFITKINPAGTAIVYSTYLGGSGDDFAEAVTVDSFGAVYVTGNTFSTDFPMVNPIQGIYGGDNGSFPFYGDAFVTKLSPSGTAITYSTYLGGANNDGGNAIAIDNNGAVYVTGVTTSLDFPLANPIQSAINFAGDDNAFVTKINPAGSALVYSTYLGGTLYDVGYSIGVDLSGAAYIAGVTTSPDFPLVSPLQGTPPGGMNSLDFFVTKINPAGSTLVYSTNLGGSGTESSPGLAIDSTGAVYITGSSSSTDYPTAAPLQSANAGGNDIVVSKINPSGSALVYSTYLGGSRDDYTSAIAIDASGASYVAGISYSTDYPLATPIQNLINGYDDAFVTKINPAGSALLYSTYLGGESFENSGDIAVDSSGAAYIAGGTLSIAFPLSHPLQVIEGGSFDAFLAKISPGTPPVLSLALTPDIFSVVQGTTFGYTVTVTNTTTTTQCFNYWENVALASGATYPATGELFGPVHLCLNGGASKSAHLTHGVPLSAPLGRYALNAYVGTHPTPITSEAHFPFNIWAFNPITQNPQTSWRILEKGFK